MNPLCAAKRPRAPQPDSPSPEEAAKIIKAAWEQDEDWETFVWLTLLTGARRGELLAPKWEDVDLLAGILTIQRNLIQRNDQTTLKDTKTHQMRRISLDPSMVEILSERKSQRKRRRREIDTTLADDTYRFSYAPDNHRPCDPSGITHRYSKSQQGAAALPVSRLPRRKGRRTLT